jgi:hypothetical protein
MGNRLTHCIAMMGAMFIILMVVGFANVGCTFGKIFVPRKLVFLSK